MKSSTTATMTTEYEHGELLKSITVRAFYVRDETSFLIDETGNSFQAIDIDNLESNKSFEIKNVVIEKRNNFSFNYSMIGTRLTQIIKLKRNIKVQFKKKFEKFSEAKPNKVTNLKCILMKQDGVNLTLFDGQMFRMKLKQELTFNSDKLEILFVKKSNGYKFAWETDLTSFIEANDKDPDWNDIELPEVNVHDNPNDIPIDQIGKWLAMLTTVSFPFTYSKF